MQPNWQKESIIYQIYPRSFQDSDGDGVGDLRGILQRLDYLQALGVTVLWLSPIFASPNADNGYDVSDYRAIQPEFGTMTDFDELLAEAHARGLKIILDLVVNHSSDEHEWFRESRKSKANPFRDFYVWKPAKSASRIHSEGINSLAMDADRRKEFPNNWQSLFGGPAWTWDEATGEFYLHLFVEKQPDLNWENPRLRREVYDLMRFWLDRGVDGFRLDVVPFFSKDQTFPDYPPERFADLSAYANGPRIHEFLREMHGEVWSKYDALNVGEGVGVRAGEANRYVGKSRKELQMLYHFDHAVPRDEARFLDPAPEFSLVQLKEITRRWDEALGDDGWQSVYFGNHDNPRLLSRFGDPLRYRYESATMLATVLLTLRGTPSLYQGDEIGMTNCPFGSVEEFDDVQVRNAHESLVRRGGGDEKQFLAAANRIARDQARTPFQWDASPNAGFTTGKPWLKVNPNFSSGVNATAEETAPRSILAFYRNLIELRKQTPALVYGRYRDLRPDDNAVWLYEREWEGETWLVACNFTADYQPLEIDWLLVHGNYGDQAGALRPFEARIYQC
jgi:oligo-1,6-glucosidase